MTVIRNNSISGINSITAQSGALNFYDSTGNTLSIGASVSGNITGDVTGNLTGNVTVATGATISGSTNTITASTNGSERVGITSDGDVFIGNTAHANDSGVDSSYRTITLADTTNGAQLHLRGQSPKVFFDRTDGGNAEIYYDTGDFIISSGEPGNAGSTERLRIDSSGRVTMPYQPLAIVGTTVNNYSPGAGTTVQLDYAAVNRGNHYDTSTYTFTCPVAGDYLISFRLSRHGFCGDVALFKNGSEIRRLEIRTHGLTSAGSANWQSEEHSFVINCATNDSFYWYVANKQTAISGSLDALLDGYNGVVYDSITYRLLG